MAQIISFEKMSVKKAIDNRLGFDQLEFEILITVMRYLFAYMEDECDNPFEVIHLNASIKELMSGSQERFAHVYVELMKYWELDGIDWKEIPLDSPFETFQTVEDLCLYMDKKISDKISS